MLAFVKTLACLEKNLVGGRAMARVRHKQCGIIPKSSQHAVGVHRSHIPSIFKITV